MQLHADLVLEQDEGLQLDLALGRIDGLDARA